MNKKTKSAGITKLATGIPGFDHLTGGGLPANRTTLVLGGSGTGKTVFALHSLVEAARRGEPGIFVSFQEHPRQLMESAASFGWELADLEKKKLLFLDARMQPGIVKVGHFDLMGMLAGLRAVATELGAKRIVFDSMDVLLTLLDDRMAELQEVFRLRGWLFDNGFTSLITANLEVHEARAAQRHAFMQFIADCTISFDFRQSAHSAARHLRVVKYRGSGFLEREFPFNIGSRGFEVQSLNPEGPRPARGLEIYPEIEQARRELSSRVQALDRFLEIKQAELNFLLEKESLRGSPTIGRVKGLSKRSDGLTSSSHS